MIKPTIGRIVWFWDNLNQSQPYAGIICHVHSDTLVNLTVFDVFGETIPRLSVTLYQGDGDRPNTSFAEWMPYQKGQAAKTEQLEKELSK